MHVDMFGFQYVSSVCHDCHDCHVAVKLVVIMLWLCRNMSKQRRHSTSTVFVSAMACSVISPVGHLPGRCPSRVSLRPPGTAHCQVFPVFHLVHPWTIRSIRSVFFQAFFQSNANPSRADSLISSRLGRPRDISTWFLLAVAINEHRFTDQKLRSIDLKNAFSSPMLVKKHVMAANFISFKQLFYKILFSQKQIIDPFKFRAQRHQRHQRQLNGATIFPLCVRMPRFMRSGADCLGGHGWSRDTSVDQNCSALHPGFHRNFHRNFSGREFSKTWTPQFFFFLSLYWPLLKRAAERIEIHFAPPHETKAIIGNPSNTVQMKVWPARRARTNMDKH